MRTDSKKIAVLITDGESQDDTRLPSQHLRDTGIEIFTIGDWLSVWIVRKKHSLRKDNKIWNALKLQLKPTAAQKEDSQAKNMGYALADSQQ